MKKIIAVALSVMSLVSRAAAEELSEAAPHSVVINEENAHLYGVDLLKLAALASEKKLNTGNLNVRFDAESTLLDISDLDGYTFTVDIDQVKTAQPNAKD